MTTYRYSCGHSVNYGEGRDTCPACESGLLQGIESFRMYHNKRLPGSAIQATEVVYTVHDSYGNTKSQRHPEVERRKHPQLTNLIDDYLAKGWEITNRHPLTIRRGRAGYELRNWCLISL